MCVQGMVCFLHCIYFSPQITAHHAQTPEGRRPHPPMLTVLVTCKSYLMK